MQIELLHYIMIVKKQMALIFTFACSELGFKIHILAPK